MASVDMCEHEWPGSGCRECFPRNEPDRDPTMVKMTGEWFPGLPKAYEKSVVLGGGLVLFPCPDPQATAEILSKYATELAKRAYQAGRRAAKDEIRKAIFE